MSLFLPTEKEKIMRRVLGVDCLTLFLGEDELGGEGVLGVGDGVVQEADAAHHTASLLDCSTDNILIRTSRHLLLSPGV